MQCLTSCDTVRVSFSCSMHVAVCNMQLSMSCGMFCSDRFFDDHLFVWPVCGLSGLCDHVLQPSVPHGWSRSRRRSTGATTAAATASTRTLGRSPSGRRRPARGIMAAPRRSGARDGRTMARRTTTSARTRSMSGMAKSTSRPRRTTTAGRSSMATAGRRALRRALRGRAHMCEEAG